MSPRTPLVHPGRYFSDREPDRARGLVAAALFTAATAGLVFGVGAVFADRIDGTVTVDNPDRPPEAFCDSAGGNPFESTSVPGFDCSAPEKIERNVDAVLNDAVGQLLGPALVGAPVGLLVAAASLHAGTALAGGRGGFGATFTVTAWGFVPAVVAMPVSLALLWLTMDPVIVTPATDPETLRTTVTGSFDPHSPPLLAVNLAATAWSAVVWTAGLEHCRDVSRGGAGTVAVAVAGLFALLSLV